MGSMQEMKPFHTLIRQTSELVLRSLDILFGWHSWICDVALHDIITKSILECVLLGNPKALVCVEHPKIFELPGSMEKKFFFHASHSSMHS